MQALWPFLKFPVKTVDLAVGGIVEHNEEPTMGIYTDSGRTALASVWADSGGLTPKVNPVAQNVGGNNSFEGYLTAGQPYYWEIGTGISATTGSFFAGTDTYPTGITIGEGDATKTIAITADSDGRTFVTRDGANQMKIYTNGSVVWGSDEQNQDVPTNDLTEWNTNPMARVGMVYRAERGQLFVRSLGGLDVGNAFNITGRRTGDGDENTTGAVTDDMGLMQIIAQGDHSQVPDQASFHGMSSRIVFKAAQTFTTDTTHAGKIEIWTTRMNVDGDGNKRFTFRPEGDVWLEEITDTPTHPEGDALGFYVENQIFKAQNASSLKLTIPQLIVAQTTWNPGSIADGGRETVEVSAVGTLHGMPCGAGFDVDLQGMAISASCYQDNAIKVTLLNNTGGPLDIGSGTLTAWSMRRII